MNQNLLYPEMIEGIKFRISMIDKRIHICSIHIAIQTVLTAILGVLTGISLANNESGSVFLCMVLAAIPIGFIFEMDARMKRLSSEKTFLAGLLENKFPFLLTDKENNPL